MKRNLANEWIYAGKILPNKFLFIAIGTTILISSFKFHWLIVLGSFLLLLTFVGLIASTSYYVKKFDIFGDDLVDIVESVFRIESIIENRYRYQRVNVEKKGFVLFTIAEDIKTRKIIGVDVKVLKKEGKILISQTDENQILIIKKSKFPIG